RPQVPRRDPARRGLQDRGLLQHVRAQVLLDERQRPRHGEAGDGRDDVPLIREKEPRSMSIEKPDHHDADLVLRVYEMRREAVRRQSRDGILMEVWAKSYEDFIAVTKREHPLNAAFRQAGTYWEMVYGMVKHGIVHPGYFLETNGEGLFLFAKVQPYLE